EEFLKSDAVTAKYLTGELEIEIPTQRRIPLSKTDLTFVESHARPTKKKQAPKAPIYLSPKWITIKNARGNNLKNIDVEIPLGLFVCVTGVSGSGKSTLIQDTLFPRLMYEVYGTRTVWEPHDGVSGLDHFDKVIDIDQSPI